MPVHQWRRVEAGIFHDFHHAWIEEIKRTLNSGLLPPQYYAMAEQPAAGFGPDVLTLQTAAPEASNGAGEHVTAQDGGTLLMTQPEVQLIVETDLEHYRRKQSAVVVRHVSGDRIVAMVELVSPGNKASRHALRSFVEKAAELLGQGIHLLIVELQPPTSRDPQGIHGTIWEQITGRQ